MFTLIILQYLCQFFVIWRKYLRYKSVWLIKDDKMAGSEIFFENKLTKCCTIQTYALNLHNQTRIINYYT